MEKNFRFAKRISVAVIALLEALVLICATTMSWIEGTKRGYIKEESAAVVTGDGLMFTDVDGNKCSEIVLPTIDLQDCSSKDGRNFYIPVNKSYNYVPSATYTSNMTFREATQSDINTKFISQDFHIQSFTGANIYIDNSSYVTSSKPDVLKALRISLNFNDGQDPILLCPGVQRTGYTETSKPVLSITDAGVATANTNIVSYPFANYTYNVQDGQNFITEIEANETKRITISVWLEGTDTNCTTSNIPTDSISISLKFTTAKSFTKQVTFVDYSPNQWVKNASDNGKNCIMYAIDKSTFTGTNYNKGVAYELTKHSDNITYTALLPEKVTDVVFARYDPAHSDNYYNVWANSSSVNMSQSVTNTYYAIGRGMLVDGVNYGYWVKDSCKGVMDVYVTETKLKYENNYLYFTNTNSWTNVYAYFFDNNSNAVGTAWPGTKMTYAYINDFSQRVYKILPPSGATKVVFNSNVSGDSNQTVDIAFAQDMANQTMPGYYLSGSQDSTGKQKVTNWSVNGVFANYEYNPNIYFTSSAYNSQLSAVANLGGNFKPSSSYSSSNCGFNMEYAGLNAVSGGQRVYHMILPADAKLIFNGMGNKSALLSPSSSFTISQTSFQKIGYTFSDGASTYTVWTPDSTWPKT